MTAAGVATACVALAIFGVTWRIAEFALWLLEGRDR